MFMTLAPSAWAQTATGNVFGRVADESGAVLPGASVTLAGDVGTRTTIADSAGDFRFLNLDYGIYKVTVALQGFSSQAKSVTVVTGQNANLAFSLKVGSMTDSVEVTGEAPLVDVKKRGTGTILSAQDLQDTPNSRDPWGVMNQVPGALIDRVNIAGNENGQQAAVTGKGAVAADRVWSIDGLVMTDMSATGASPSYYDFGAFQEINVSTGGGDLTMQTGGFGMNLVTKRGTNTFHGGARYLITDDKYQSSNLPAALQNDARLSGGTGACAAPAGQRRDKADYINSITDYGFDLGGPIVKDKLWFYGTYGKQDIKLCRLAGTPDDTLLPSYNFKLNWQASGNTTISAFYFVGKKQKFGRSPGTGQGFEEDGILWNQDDNYTEGGLPGGLWKLEANHTFSPSFFMSAKAAYYDTGFGLTARGDKTKSFTYENVSNSAIGTIINFLSARPQKTANVDANYFFSGTGGNHELKFGFGYRDVTSNSTTHYNGNQIVGFYEGPREADGSLAQVTRDGVVSYGGKYTSAYVGDAFTKGRLTLNFGARFDRQTARNLPSEAPANSAFAARLPALTYAGDAQDLVKWNAISPRLGMSYALNESRKTVLRLSGARYASQLSFGIVAGGLGENPVAVSAIFYGWNDLNGDKFVQPNEVNFNNLVAAANVNPNSPGAVGSTPNKVDRDLKPKFDNEVVLGVDHELGSNFAIGGALTYRSTTDYQYTPRLAAPCPLGTDCSVIGPASYTANAPITRSGFTAQTFSPNAPLVTAGGFGRYRTNQPGYSTQFKGLELTLNKRMADRWGGRVAFSLNDWTEHFDGTPVSTTGSPTRTQIAGLQDGGQVSIAGGGSGKVAFYSSYKWQVFASAIVRLPLDLDLSTSIFGRQGGLLPIVITAAAGADGNVGALAVPSVDTERYDTLWNADLRLARNVKIGRATLTASAEVFNVLNNDVVLGVTRVASAATFRRVDEIISPRILRVGARLSF
jgi:hypothetical protein